MHDVHFQVGTLSQNLRIAQVKHTAGNCAKSSKRTCPCPKEEKMGDLIDDTSRCARTSTNLLSPEACTESVTEILTPAPERELMTFVSDEHSELYEDPFHFDYPYW
jgi:hypothetical protein